ncbi:MAG: mechanosensitive ion channel family protein [Eubacteriales bacterium]|nr:mechanosensitive ion channel family protein [Eubacteriales bacterium]
MQNRKKRIRRAIVDVLLEIAGLLTLAALLWNVQIVAVQRQQESNSATKLHIAQQRLEHNAAEAADNLQTYDSFSQATVDTIAYFLDRSPDSADLAALCGQWGLSSWYLLDAQGNVAQSSAPGQALPALGDALQSRAPVTLEGELRYYFAETANGGLLVGGRDESEEAAKLSELTAPAHALSTLKVGTTGFVFAIREADGVIAWHPDASLIGRSAAQAGLNPALYPNGYDGWATFGGARYYCMSRSASGLLLAAIVPEAELMQNARRTTALSVLIFAIVISLLAIYAFMLRQDQDRHPTRTSEYRKVGGLYLDRTVATKIRNVAVIGLIAVFGATFYVQTLAALSRQSLISETKLTSVEEILLANSTRISDLTEEYNTEYTRRAQNIAWTLAQDPTLVQDDALTELAEKAQIKAIYVFNKMGRTVATNTHYKDFVISSSEADQSYPFWQVVKGYVDELAQPVMEDDTAHTLLQYVGVKRLDADGMVQLGMSPRRIANRLHTTTLPYVLSSIAVENGGMLFAVDTESGSFVSYPTEKYIGRSAAQYGLTEAALADDYAGSQTVNGVSCFVSTLLWENTAVCVAVPLSSIYAQRLPISLWALLISFIIIALMSCFLVFGGKPGEDTPADAASAAQPRFFRVFQPNGTTRVVQSAASRWAGARQPWAELTPEQKLTRLTGWIISAAILALVCALWLPGAKLDQSSILSYILGRRWERGLNLFSATYAVITLLEVLVVATLTRKLITFTLSRFGARSETIGRLLDSFIKYAAILGVVFYCLNIFGVDSTALITSAGILSLVVGLGAQSLIGDILAGIFIVFEGEFRVGDIVTIGDWRGTVLEIGIRTTKIESAGSDIKIFNNSAISGVINMTKQFSYAFVDVGIEYGESLERVESVLQKELPVMKQHLPAIVNGPFYKGVASLGESSVNIRIVAQCQEKDRVQLVRDMNREMKLIFDRHDVNIPFPQVVVNQPAAHEQPTRAEVRQAKAFVEEQKELTRDIHVREDEA